MTTIIAIFTAIVMAIYGVYEVLSALTIVSSLIYGIIIGVVAKVFYAFIYGSNEVVGWIQTMLVGIIGSYVGLLIHYSLNGFHTVSTSSGFLLNVVGAFVVLVAHHYLVVAKGNTNVSNK